MKILVTGCAGFIGSNFIKYIFQQHADWGITNIDKLTYAGNLENLQDVEQNPNYFFIRGDIADSKLIEVELEKGYDAIINFAAESHVDRSIMDSSPFIETNINGTRVLLDGAKKYKIEKFIQISTDEVYGSIEKGSFGEKSPLAPSSPYSASKAAADLLALSYWKTHGTPVIVTRSSNNLGPYQFPEKLIPLAITNIMENKSVPVYGDGLNIRDWIFVEDNCRALEQVLLKGRPGEIYNIAVSQEKTNIELIRTLLAILGKPESLITYIKDRPGHDRRYAIDNSKIKKELDWQPRYTFEKSLSVTVEWYKSNKVWWQRIKSGEYAGYYDKLYSGR